MKTEYDNGMEIGLDDSGKIHYYQYNYITTIPEKISQSNLRKYRKTDDTLSLQKPQTIMGVILVKSVLGLSIHFELENKDSFMLCMPDEDIIIINQLLNKLIEKKTRMTKLYVIPSPFNLNPPVFIISHDILSAIEFWNESTNFEIRYKDNESILFQDNDFPSRILICISRVYYPPLLNED